MPASVSVIVTILNEAKHLPDLLDSLAAQEPPFEVLIVDAGSTDGSLELAQRRATEDSRFKVFVHESTRGGGRNHGAQRASGEYVALIDGDCIANAFWLQRLREMAGPRVVVAGRSVTFGYWAFERLQRVELDVRGQDVTYPSSNLLYPREAFLKLGGFDERFITAEDIDLNYRAVEAGLHVRYAAKAVAYHHARDSVMGFLRQAFWNGYGRKQLTLKHGRLWTQYSFKRLISQELHFWGLLRMASATLGYAQCRLRETRRQWALPTLAPLKEATPRNS